jgi:disulfide bond formation protein DsbB
MFTFIHMKIILLNMKFFKENALPLVLAISIVATVGSLFFSEVMKLPPCVLCWYQRICMYPLVVISLIGLWKNDKNLPLFILPLSIIGLAISIYHNLLYYKIIPESITPCTTGISCTTKQIELLGFITIPLLSLAAFSLITIITLLYIKYSSKK